MNTESEPLQTEFFGHEHVTVIEPQRGWRTLDLRELLAYRELLAVLTMRDDVATGQSLQLAMRQAQTRVRLQRVSSVAWNVVGRR